jgi:thymidylate synthase
MNKLDTDYQNLLKDILENGIEKSDRTGTGTISVFGRQIRHKMSDGFPILTTKRVHFKSVISELLWFLKGETQLKWLLDHNNTIWVGDSYKRYKTTYEIESREGSYGLEKLRMLSDLTQDEFIERIKTDDEFAKKWGELGPIYGAQWRSWDTTPYGWDIKKYGKGEWFSEGYKIDQIQNLIYFLKTNPDSRRLMVNAWNVGELDQMILPPCHYGFQVYTRELSLEERLKLWDTRFGFSNEQQKNQFNTDVHLDTHGIPKRAISLMFNMRSNDVPLGLPFNIASYGLLLTLLGKLTNMIPDELIGNLGDTHIYKNQIDGVKEQLTREPFKLPQLNINTEFWPTESGECGIGNIDANSWLEGLNDWNFVKCLIEEDIQLVDYQYHPPIKLPLSN